MKKEKNRREPQKDFFIIHYTFCLLPFLGDARLFTA